jgi:hypothetical protein
MEGERVKPRISDSCALVLPQGLAVFPRPSKLAIFGSSL